MNQDDRYKTTSWDGDEVAHQAGRTGDPRSAGEERSPRSAGESQERSRSAGNGKKRKKRRKKRTNPLLAILLWLVIVGASSAIFAAVGWMLANDFAALNKEPMEASFQVTEDFVSEVVQEEQKDGSMKEVTHYDMKKVAAALKEKGLIEYDWFTTGGKAETVKLTIPEGYTVSQIITLLAENGVGSVEDLTDTAANYEFDSYTFVDNENLGDARRLEGYLFPDTYEFYVGARTELAFNSILENFKNKVYANEDLTDLFAESDYSLKEILTMASLIERETDGSDQANISSVIHNRLEKGGETGHLLQIDAALVYAAGRPINQEDYTSLDSPYNLYLHEGLPPTPISNPGLASIRAALSPAENDYYFYVLMGDKHVFSETLAEHNRNVAKAAEAAAQAEE